MSIVIRPLTVDDAEACFDIEQVAFPNLSGLDRSEMDDYVWLAERFQEGCVVAEYQPDPDDDGNVPDEPAQVVGFGTGIRLDFDFQDPQHNGAEILGREWEGHDPNGRWYYGVDIAVHPDFQGQGIARLLYNARKSYVRRAKLRGIVAGGVLPGYADHRYMTPFDYVTKVVTEEIWDPTLSVQLRNGFQVWSVLHNYVMSDRETNGVAALIVWANPDFAWWMQ